MKKLLLLCLPLITLCSCGSYEKYYKEIEDKLIESITYRYRDFNEITYKSFNHRYIGKVEYNYPAVSMYDVYEYIITDSEFGVRYSNNLIVYLTYKTKATIYNGTFTYFEYY